MKDKNDQILTAVEKFKDFLTANGAENAVILYSYETKDNETVCGFIGQSELYVLGLLKKLEHNILSEPDNKILDN